MTVHRLWYWIGDYQSSNEMVHYVTWLVACFLLAHHHPSKSNLTLGKCLIYIYCADMNLIPLMCRYVGKKCKSITSIQARHYDLLCYAKMKIAALYQVVVHWLNVACLLTFASMMDCSAHFVWGTSKDMYHEMLEGPLLFCLSSSLILPFS